MTMSKQTVKRNSKAMQLQAQSLFHRLKSEHGAERAEEMVTMVLQNSELWQKISKELYM